MIARIDAHSDVAATYQRFLEALVDQGFEGDIAPDYANRTVLATDNSIYQRLPQAVLYPRGTEDLVRIAELAGREAYHQVVLAPRGGGTGTNGQALTDGLVVDVSRYMNAILEIDAEGHRVRVQAGVVKDQLNAALKPHGLFFAPELSTSNRATLGGMIATDASGQGSCEYGKTRDHVLELESVLLGGERLVTRPVDEDELSALCARQDTVGRVYRAARDILEREGERIRKTFPPLNRCLTGYDLAHLITEDGSFDLSSVLCGAEGSLAFTSEAVLRVLPIPAHSTLVNVRYAGFMDALGDAQALMASDAAPTSIETVDERVLQLARGDYVWDSVGEFFPDAGDSRTQGINLIEFNDDDPARLARRVEAFCRHLDEDPSVRRLGHTRAQGREAISRVYAMRKRAVGLLGNVAGEKRPLPFVEDTAVPPEHLADYIAEFRALLDARGLEYGMFGHVDAGVLHVRPALDMKDPAQEALIREITDEVAVLTHKYGGLLWGEHGKGLRSEYAPAFFGPLYPSLCRLKGAFDPYNQLNPGKIATPLSSPSDDAGKARVSPPLDGAGEAPLKWSDPGLLAVDGVATRGQFDRQIDERVWQAYGEAVHCNGNGACYNYHPDDAMCPSWKATRQRIHSPKGRASLMREWLRLQQQAGVDVLDVSRRLRKRDAWSALKVFPAKLGRSLARRRGQRDVSHQVHEAMAGCLSCKSCAGQCPIKVDVPSFRARFLELYHSRYLRSPRDHLVGGLERMVPLLARFAPLYNAMLRTPGVERAMAGVLGLVDSPRLSRERLDVWLEQRGIERATPGALQRLDDAEKARSVVLVQDAFTSYFDSRVVMDTVELLECLGVRVFVAPYGPNGKPLHVQGFLGAFERTAARQASRLQALADAGVALVGIDPAMTLTYRQEYVKALGAAAVPQVQLLASWLVQWLADGTTAQQAARQRVIEDPGYRLLLHCTEATHASGAAQDWQHLFEALGLSLEVLQNGCCGMSGTYGHEAEHRETSAVIYGQSWRPRVEDPGLQGRLLATGYSCRCQARRFSGAALSHPLQGLLACLGPPGAT